MKKPLTTALLCLFLLGGLLLPGACGIAVSAGESLPDAYPNPLTRTWVFGARPDGDASRFDFGASLRSRYVDFDNVLALGSEPDPHRRFFRIRTRVWGERWFSPGWRLFAQINNESRSYLKCESCESKFDEVIVENLFFEFTNHGSNPMGLRIGRQDLFYGDGFVICDGTPLDGSRTSYVNGILLTTAIPDWSFDIFAVWNRDKDEWLPRINNQYTPLLEYDEFVGGLYVRGFKPEEAPKPYTIDYYYIFTEEETSARFASINTFGARFETGLGRARITAEAAYQAGRAPESRFLAANQDLAGPQSIAAFGDEAQINLNPLAGLPLDLSAGYVHLTGDDPLTRNKFEGWNPIMGRWPKWSELYIYTLGMAAEVQPLGQGVAFWQNFKAPHIGMLITPRPGISLEARHIWMRADTSIPSDPNVAPEGKPERPKDRGNLLVLKVTWSAEVGMPISGHVLYERFDPGGYYRPDAETAGFFRLELSTSL
jgi:hypothetical protein